MTEAPSIRRLAVYCGSNRGTDPKYAEGAEALGNELVRRGIGLVYGGGKVGLMGVLADTVLGGGGEVIGVIPEALYDLEVGHEGCDLRVVANMHQRKREIYELVDAAVALPGGIGTFDELFETLTWNQLGYHAKPTGLLDIEGYFDPLIAMLQRATRQGFVRPEDFQQLQVAATAADLLDALAAVQQLVYPKWIDS